VKGIEMAVSKIRRCSAWIAAFLLCLLAPRGAIAAAPSPSSAPALPTLTAAQIVARLEARNEERAQELQHFSVQRIYHIDYRGFLGPREAGMVVDADYSPAIGKTFRVVNESGSSALLHNLLHRLLLSEQQAQDDAHRQDTALSAANYEFTLLGCEGNDYVLRVTPRTDNQYLYRGTIWVDAHDFAVSRMEVQPGRNPSFWTHHIRIDQRYARVGEFWLPASNRTVTAVRLGGIANLTIAYQNYVVRGHGDSALRAARAAVHLPAPALRPVSALVD